MAWAKVHHHPTLSRLAAWPTTSMGRSGELARLLDKTPGLAAFLQSGRVMAIAARTKHGA